MDMTAATFGATHLDPTKTFVQGGDFYWDFAIYDTLLHINPDGSYSPGLALGAKTISPTAITVTLRAGEQFSDGTPFNGATVKEAILRNESFKKAAFLPVFFDLSSIEVNSPTEITLELSKPEAGAFYPLLAENEFFLSSPAASSKSSINLDAQPVGAGPYLVKSYTPNQRIELEKNSHYWNAAKVRLAALNIINVPAGPQQLTALESGQVDIESGLVASQVNALRQNGMTWTTNLRNNDAIRVGVCKSTPPFDSPLVRQALNYATDKLALNQTVEAGMGQPQWGLFPIGAQYHVNALDGFYSYDPQKAKALLAQAGYPSGFSTSLTISPGDASLSQVAQILQAEWSQVGVKLKLVTTTNVVQTFYQEHETPLAIGAIGEPNINTVAAPYTPGYVGDICNYSNPQLNSWVQQLSAGSMSPVQANETWSNIQQLVVKTALAIFGVFVPVVTAWNSHVSQVEILQTFYGFTPNPALLVRNV